jgi:hypothetical protein
VAETTSWAGEAWGLSRAVEILAEIARIDRTVKVGDGEAVELSLITRELRAARAVHELHRKIVRLKLLCSLYRDELERMDRKKANALALDAQAALPL